MKRIHYKHFAFTGSKDRITSAQLTALERQLKYRRECGYLWMHNGDCITSDEAAARLWIKAKGKVMLHPPINPTYRAHFKEASIICEADEYLHRDHHMVDLSQLLIATPQTFDEQRRSGTWTTVRYARTLRLKIDIIFPDGTLKKERP